ncbi:MAG: lysoplasmalogenase [Chloroflexota bacterium]
MKPALYPVLVLIPTAFFLIRAEIAKKQSQIYILKPICTLLVIGIALLALLEPAPNKTYLSGVLLGLLFSFGGDLALMFQENRKAFMIGLVLFLLAHVAYTVLFALLGRFSAWDILSTVVLLAVGLGFYRLIQPNLGAMKLPVIIYIVVISLMVSRAISTLFNPAFTTGQGIMIAVGAVLFYVSDLILAAGRFWKPWKYHRISLVFYYSGQLLIALAASG